MSMLKPELRLTFDSGNGEQYTIAIGLEDRAASDLMVPAPEKRAISFGGEVHAFDRVVTLLRQKKFRKDLFVRECQRLGMLLAERMEDAEGWHDESRVEQARRQLKDFQRTL